MARIARDATPRRRSSRISSQNSTKKGSPPKRPLDSLTERDETPDIQRPIPKNVFTTPTAVRQNGERAPEPSTICTPTTEPQVQPEQMHPATVHQTLSQRFSPGIELDIRPIHTQSAKPSIESLQGTPSRPKSVSRASTAPRQSMARTNISPGFQFKFAHQSNMSEEGQKLMDTIRDEAAKIKAQMKAEKELQEQRDAEADGLRRIAKPKGKSGRFSEVHMEHFKKMDSITNHPSAFRAAPAFARPTEQSLKRSSSKADLDDRAQTVTKSPKRHVPPPITGRPYAVSPFKSIRYVGREEPSQATKRARKNGDADVTSSRPTSIPKPVPSFMSPTKASVGRAEDASTTPQKPSGLPRSDSTKSIRSVPRASVAATKVASITKAHHQQQAIDKPLAALPNTIATSPRKPTLSPFKSIVYPDHDDSSTKSRLPMFSGLKSILKSAKIESAPKPMTPKDAEAPLTADSYIRKVDFTPSVKSRYAVKLAEGSPSPAKLDRLMAADNFQPAIPYDPSVFRNHYIDNEDDWEEADDEVTYPSLPVAPVNRTFSQYAKDHNRRESKEFKSIFTNIHPIRQSPPTGLTAANTAVNKTNPIAHTAHIVKASAKSAASPASTIRKVRSSEPIIPFEDASIPTVPHGLPGKRRRHESDLANDKHGTDEDAKENRRMSHAPNVPGSWEDSIIEEDEGDRRAGKRARRTAPAPASNILGSDSDQETIVVKTVSPIKKSAARELAAKTAKDRKKGRPNVGGALSMSRLNALARPKNRS